MNARRARWGLALFVWASAALPLVPRAAAAATPCDPPVTSPIACENSKPGNPSAEWDIAGAGDQTVQGFATDMSVNRGETVRFKVKADSAYRMDIYRLGYYGGNGARKITTVASVAAQSQPNCLEDTNTGLVDCGNWAESTSWAVPVTAVSGVYVALLTRLATGGASHVVFVVRDDASTSAVLFQTSDSTWQAYNSYGDKPTNSRSLYPGPNGSAVKVSYNRPFTTRGDVPDGRDFVFANEYPMIRWLEANGYDVTYTTDVDSDRRGALIKQHKLFLSVGHDEYWSKGQRGNVEAARDAGVNLAFFSGNSVYWKTRWESSSTSGTATPFRTLVTYKETRANAKVDPSPEWTGTWRDPRFSPPSDGGRPENELMGTAYKVNTGQFAIKVPEADGKMRLWRNTSVATLAPGAVATLEANTLGYEWDEDLDNGFRPAGLIRMSSTTENVQEYLIDYGSTVVPGVATHNLTLYRAPSGALVFGGGTVQWTWGLDGNHDGPQSNADPRMQQATANLFADMGVQPATLQPGLVAATKSVDTTPATATMTSPAPGASVPNGNITVTGTATDVGGRVGGVEVSTDGGATWHPAVGRGSWTYTGPITGAGATTVKARATDDSGNIQSTPASVSVNVSCPCTIFPSTATPATADSGDSGAIEVGLKFRSDRDAVVSGIRFFKSAANTGTHVGSLWTLNGTKLASATFTGETGSGWQQVNLATPVSINAQTTYVVSYYAPNGRYSADSGYFTGTGVDSPPLHALKNGVDGPNAVFRYQAGGGFPNQTFGAANYWVDVVVSSFGPPDTTAPTVTTKVPAAGASSVATSTKPQARFSESVQASTIGFTLTNSANATVAGSVAYDAGTKTATFTPAAALALSTTFTATVSAALDASGNAMAAPASWSFTTAANTPPPGTCPCSLWSDTAVPATPATDDQTPVEVGVKLRASADGTISGLRFYKGPGNDGPHVGSLWTSGGTLLGTVDFTTESPEGWQQASFATPIAITGGTTYVASYYAQNGRYAASGGYFSSAATVSGPLTALANGTDGPNGVYLYGTSGFPAQSFGAANYWVDVVFSIPPDLTAPTVTSSSPGAGATSVPVASTVKTVFSEAVQPSTVSLTVKTAANATVAGSVAYDATTRTATFTPSAVLGQASSYTATVSGATDPAGNAMASASSWTFTTAGVGACPCSIFDTSAVPGTPASSDGGAVELGVKFRADVDGSITGVRFYKGAGNTGTHVGSLWTSAGTLLASATFANESAAGWQQVSFATPVAITAGTTYVASYFAPNGRYAGDGGFFGTAAANAPLTALANGTDGFNGVYLYGSGGFPTQSFGAANYWVDVVFIPPPPDTTAPTVTSTSPAAAATSVAVSTTVKATFSEAVQPATVSLTLKDPANATVAGAVAYDAATRTATLTPGAVLAAASTYTATVSGAKDLAGITMTAPVSWSFTTAGVGACPCTIFDTSATPATPAANDSGAIEVGVKFRTDTNGYIYGVRFYKGTGNTGTHIGNLWTSAGVKLATATFSGESATGWQQVSFASPVAVTAGTTYVASYFAPNGRYSVDSGYFASAARVNPPLTALANGTDGPNGVYLYGAGGFPAQSFGSANYWVDVVFSTAPPVDGTPPIVSSTSPAAGGTSVPVGTTVAATFDEDVQPATIVMTLRDAANTAVGGTSAYTAASRTITFTPTAALAPAVVYTATVSGAKDVAGNAMAAPVSWSFTTAATPPPTGTCPCTIWTDATTPATSAANDSGAIEVGVKFRTDANGYIYGVRFYKGTGNTGTHIGNLWTSAGVKLATATFSGESATGWQQVSFASPVAVTAGTTYIASYFAPNGRYAVDGGYFSSTGVTRGPLTALANGADGLNGLYAYGTGGFPTNSFGAANYWVDIVFSTVVPDTTPPTVTARTPASGATGVPRTTTVTATFSEAVQPATVSVVLRDSSGNAVAATVAYDAATRVATLTPSTTLGVFASYTATVSGAKDTAGNTMAAPSTWSFTTGLV